MIIDNELATLDILDTAGQDEFLAMQEQHFRTGEGFLVIFALDDPVSLHEAAELVTKIKRARDDPTNPSKPLCGILVGNKADLTVGRRVSLRDAENYARQLGLAYMETSAKSRTNVDATFAELVRMIRTRRSQEPRNNYKKNKSQCALL